MNRSGDQHEDQRRKIRNSIAQFFTQTDHQPNGASNDQQTAGQFSPANVPLLHKARKHFRKATARRRRAWRHDFLGHFFRRVEGMNRRRYFSSELSNWNRFDFLRFSYWKPLGSARNESTFAGFLQSCFQQVFFVVLFQDFANTIVLLIINLASDEQMIQEPFRATNILFFVMQRPGLC